MALLEGLEVSEIFYKKLSKHTLSERIDAEFFKKEYLEQDYRIAKKGSQKLASLTNKIKVGFVGAMVEYYCDEGVTLFQTKNIDAFFLQDSGVIRVTNEFHNQLSKSQIVYENILIARSGSFGKASIYLEHNIVNSSDIIIVEADKEQISPYFLVAFLNSSFGVNQMIRFASGGLQGHVNLTILEELEIPNLDKIIHQEIEKVIKKSYLLRAEARLAYTQAETLLLETLGMVDFTPSTDAVNIKSFKDSFAASGRLDAEYYQLKYEQMVAHIRAQAHGRLIDLVTIQKSVEPGSDAYCDDDEMAQGLPFVRVADYSKHGLTPPQKRLKPVYVADNLDKLQILKPRKNTILFSKDGSVGEAYCLTHDLEAVTSGAVLHLTVQDTEELLPEYLTLVLNSKLVKMQSERDAGGSIILHWRVSEIENVVVPLVPMPIQRQIADLIQHSFALKAQSTHLLEVTKHAVEMAIEQDEAAAFAYIASEVSVI